MKIFLKTNKKKILVFYATKNPVEVDLMADVTPDALSVCLLHDKTA